MKLKEVIKNTTQEHLKNGGLFFGQCVTAVGWIGGTVPEMSEEEGIVELPTSDSSNSAVVCGAALTGLRPIYAIRYQGFMSYNSTTLFNYAAKSIEMWGVPCPIFVRAIGMEGSIGPVASGMFHSSAMHNPGMLVAAPITPNEWLDVWKIFMSQESPVYCSEHRKSFDIDYEFDNLYSNHSNDNVVTIIGIGGARLEFNELNKICLEKNLKINLIHIYWLKPFNITSNIISALNNSSFGIVVDSGYSICGASEHIANTLMIETGKIVYSLGLDDRTAGFSKKCDNTTPSSKSIYEFMSSKLKKYN